MVAAVGGAARALRVAQRGGVAVVLVQRGQRAAARAGLPLGLLAVSVLRVGGYLEIGVACFLVIFKVAK